jgi:hypothetical protein
MRWRNATRVWEGDQTGCGPPGPPTTGQLVWTVIGILASFALLVVVPVLFCCYASRDNPKPSANTHARVVLDQTPIFGAAPPITYQGPGFSYVAYPPHYPTPSYEDAIPALCQPEPSKVDV